MSDLQISLLAIGAVVVAGVYAFNLWQERKWRRRTEQAFAREHPDVLLDQGGAGGAVRVEPSIAAAPSLAPAAAQPAVNPTAPAIDPVIDYVVEVILPAATGGTALREELRVLMAESNKPVMAEGYVESSGDWVDVGRDSGFSRMRFAMQMSNRGGCATPVQLASFRAAVANWAGAGKGETKSLEVDAAHAMAVQIDRFCADVDIAIGINVVSDGGEPFTGSRIRALAEQHGLKLEADGLFYARGEAGEVLYTIDNHEPMPFVPEQIKVMHTSGMTFLLDVPRVAAAVPALDSMLAAARLFAAELGGRLVDDNRADLTDSAITAIRRQLDGILAKMEAGRIPAGGVRAQRLFS